MKLVHYPLMGGLLLWYSEERTGRGRSPPRSLLAVPNLTANLSTASVPITALLYNDQWLCGFNVHIKGLTRVLGMCRLEPGRYGSLPATTRHVLRQAYFEKPTITCALQAPSLAPRTAKRLIL